MSARLQAEQRMALAKEGFTLAARAALAAEPGASDLTAAACKEIEAARRELSAVSEAEREEA